jgi:hypothetical protein
VGLIAMPKITDLLSPRDIEIIGKCLHATVDGAFFDDWEFHTLFGLYRDDVRRVYNKWPHHDVDNNDLASAIRGALLNLWGYPHSMEEKLRRDWDVEAAELRDLLRRFRAIEAALRISD